MMKRRAAFIAQLLFLLVLVSSGCGHQTSIEEEPSAEPSVVMAVTGAPVRVMPLSDKVTLLGTTVAQRHITLRAPTAGVVLGMTLQSGDAVRRGQVVARIVNREALAAQQGLAVARAVDPGEVAALAAAVKRNAAIAAVPVVAPENAIVAQRIVSTGQTVADLDSLADLIDPRSIYVEAEAPISELDRIRPGMTATVVSPLRPGTTLAARVAAISPNVIAGGATAPVRLEFSDNERLEQAGAPVQATIRIDYVPNALVVPSIALFDDAATHTQYLFLARDGHAERVNVTTGIVADGLTQVTSGVKSGAIVITSGGYALSSGLAVKVALAQP
jgi:multidrug efflux pump subunit AcrA (membrane-fusion protein)